MALDRDVRLVCCDAKLAECAHALCFIGSGKSMSRREAVRQRGRACVAIAFVIEADKLVNTSGDISLEAIAIRGQCRRRIAARLSARAFKSRMAVRFIYGS
eukprot:6192395-Pleurochrysis_carterae.AAC.6